MIPCTMCSTLSHIIYEAEISGTRVGGLRELGERFNPGASAGPLNTTVMSINPNNSKNELVGKVLLSFFTAGQGSY